MVEPRSLENNTILFLTKRIIFHKRDTTRKVGLFMIEKGIAVIN